MYHVKFRSQFKRHEVTCDFEGAKLTYETQCRPLWDWILDHLVDRDLVRQFEWDARKVFRYNKEKNTYVRLYSEPWTGKRFWDVQVRSNINLFDLGTVLKRFEVKLTGRRQNALPRVVCRQNETLVVWDAERLPRNG